APRTPPRRGFSIAAPPRRGFSIAAPPRRVFLLRPVSAGVFLGAARSPGTACHSLPTSLVIPLTDTVNADPAELAKFSELAHRWWDPESEFRPLHEINPLRLEWVDGIASIAGRRVLDVGCGGGILADAMARRGAEVLGIDL